MTESIVQIRPTLDEILNNLKSYMPELRERYGVVSMGVFGSFIRCEETLDSDLDILVEFDDRPLTLLQFIGLENELSDRLAVKVDLVEKHTLKPAIGRHILREVRML